MLWLIECSHESGKQWAVNLFGLACSFRVLLAIIDELDGIRRLYNLVSTLPILSHDDSVVMSDDEEYAQRQCLRQVMVTLKRYFEGHITLKVEQLRRIHQIREFGTFSNYKPIRLSSMQVAEYIDVMFELMPFRSRWGPLDNFIQLGGVIKCFQVIANAFDWTFQGRSEMVRSALEVLAICAISPRAQLQFCERIDLPDDTKAVALNIILGAAEGELVQVYKLFLISIFFIVILWLSGPL
jgi:HIV-1 Vpr-binding protein